MALVKCTICGNDVSDKALNCPKCGANIKEILENNNIVSVYCKECGQIIAPTTGICANCGYNPAKAKEKQQRMVLIIFAILIGVVSVIVGCFLINKYQEKTYIMAACEELADEVNGLPRIEEIYFSDEVGEGSVIDYVYRVYIKYDGYWGDEQVLFIVDDAGETYFATSYGDETLANYLIVAEAEVHGIEGIWEPSEEWGKLRASEIRRIENSFD